MISLFVADVLGAVANISQQYYNDLGDGLAAVLYSVATIIFIVLVVNYLFQIKQFTFGAYVGWMIRITIIITAATSWAAYEPIYNAARAIPDNIAATLLGGEDVFTALDAMIDKGFEVAANSFEQGDWYDLAPYFTGIVIWLVTGILAALGMFIGATAHVGLALSLGLAPIFISALLLESTSQLFASWTRFVIGFMVTLIVMAGVIGIITGIFKTVVEETNVEGDLASWGAFIVSILVSAFFLLNIPSLASTLAGGIVSAGTGFAQATGMASAMKDYSKMASGGLTSAVQAPAKAVSSVKDSHQRYNARKEQQLSQQMQKMATGKATGKAGGKP